MLAERLGQSNNEELLNFSLLWLRHCSSIPSPPPKAGQLVLRGLASVFDTSGAGADKSVLVTPRAVGIASFKALSFAGVAPSRASSVL